jgi:hypothetical protein
VTPKARISRLDCGRSRDLKSEEVASSSRPDRPDELDFMVLSPGGAPDAALAVAGCRAGALGVLNLEFVPESERALGELGRLSRSTRTRWGVLLREAELLAGILAARFEGLETILISSQAGGTLGDLVERAHAAGLKASA